MKSFSRREKVVSVSSPDEGREPRRALLICATAQGSLFAIHVT